MADSLHKDFNNFLTQELNEPQRQAVQQSSGALLVIAGAGSGKTRVITTRIANLVINNEIDPGRIVALTFTNKAAGEMRERLINTFQSHYRTPFIGTFHSYCLLLLRSNPYLLPFPSFSILDADDQLDLLKKISKKYSLAKHITPSHLCHHISRYKNSLMQQTNDMPYNFAIPMFREIYLEYEAEKSHAHSLDFDDLITQILIALQKNSLFKEQFQKNVRHILIDEYQDTSHVQHQLLLNMALNDKKECVLDSICAVGDEDQSIYSWRGATVANMMRFKTDFAPVTTIKIEQNYRSVQPILEAANQVIENNKLRNPKNLWSTHKATNRILALACHNGDQEAYLVGQLIKNRESKQKLNGIAILYRTHFQSRSLEEALIHQGIPYRIVGGIRFYERKEVKDLLAYLRLIVNPYDKMSLIRIINTPSRGFGPKFEDQLIQRWATNPLCDFVQILEEMRTDLSPAKDEALQEFLAIFNSLTPNSPPHHIIQTILERTEYCNYLSQAYEPHESQAKIENVQEFAQAILFFEQTYQSRLESNDVMVTHANSLVEAFLHEVSLLQEKLNDETNTNYVHMMTLHAAKGLEFDTVIITGLDEGLLPSTKSLNTNEELEEERRLMYVGMTRAKQHLVLTNAFSRFTFGHIVDQAPSRFLDEIPRSLLQTITIDQNNINQAQSFFDHWFTRGTLTPVSVAKKPTSTVKTATTATARRLPTWTKNKVVYHAKFGVGIVSEIERAPEDDFYITVLFKAGKKKILGRFLEAK